MGSASISRSDTPMTDSQLSQLSTASLTVATSLTLDDLLTLEPLLPSDKEKSLFENYERQHRTEFDQDPEEAAKKLEPAEKFMYWLSRPVIPPTPAPQQREAQDALAMDNTHLLVSRPLLSTRPSLTSLRSRLSSSNSSMACDVEQANDDVRPLSIDEYITAAIAMLRFEVDLETAESQIRELIEGCDALRMSENLKVLFLGVLKVGNMLNTVYARRRPESAKVAVQPGTVPPPPPRPPVITAPIGAIPPPPPPPPIPSNGVKSGSCTPILEPAFTAGKDSCAEATTIPSTTASAAPPPPPALAFSSASGIVAGGAAGFRLHSLLKLRDVRALDNKSNLMHYLAHMASETNKDLLALPDQFRFLSKLEQYRTREILEQVVECERIIKLIRKFRERVNKSIVAVASAGARLDSQGGYGFVDSDYEEEEVAAEGRRSMARFSDLRTRGHRDSILGDCSSAAAMASFMSGGRVVLLRLDSFLNEAQRRYLQLLDAVEMLDKSWNAMATYFGEKMPVQNNSSYGSGIGVNPISAQPMPPPPPPPPPPTPMPTPMPMPNTPLPASFFAIPTSGTDSADTSGPTVDALHPPFLDQMISSTPTPGENATPAVGSGMSRSPSFHTNHQHGSQGGSGGAGGGGGGGGGSGTHGPKYQRKPPEEIFAVLNEFLRHFREAHLQNEDAEIRKRRKEHHSAIRTNAK
ncbi:hypothetical protein DFQ27_007977 [Actinomortierella ambigua]|uniref:FH2 domain-containing protein n=1 Tax=Actinomortierella ambigua TaxID=1343610 RepID=A0A9P6QJC8_9FUNG|nr:hypothetical protein DFQ27_007977 [Actinomortierella ambigua]